MNRKKVLPTVGVGRRAAFISLLVTHNSFMHRFTRQIDSFFSLSRPPSLRYEKRHPFKFTESPSSFLEQDNCVLQQYRQRKKALRIYSMCPSRDGAVSKSFSDFQTVTTHSRNKNALVQQYTERRLLGSIELEEVFPPCLAYLFHTSLSLSFSSTHCVWRNEFSEALNRKEPLPPPPTPDFPSLPPPPPSKVYLMHYQCSQTASCVCVRAQWVGTLYQVQ